MKPITFLQEMPKAPPPKSQEDDHKPGIGIRLEMEQPLSEKVDALIEQMSVLTSTLQEVIQRPPYVIVQPADIPPFPKPPRRMRHTPVRDPQGRIDYVIVEPDE